MFEIIGLLIATTVYFVMSGLLSLIVGGLTWLLLRGRRLRRTRSLLGVGLPIACALYMFLCEVVFPGRSLFGDIAEPLPHGYELQALGKMPDYGHIETISNPSDQPQLKGWIGTVAVEGNVVFGTYSHLLSGRTDESALDSCCFAFDTMTKITNQFGSKEEMDEFAHHNLKLVDLPDFKSAEAPHIGLMRAEKIIQLVPPVIALVSFGAVVFWWRRQSVGMDGI